MLDHWICLVEGDRRVCVDPQLGGHVVEFSLAGKNALHESGPAIGSTFWPSPQSDWNWPPPAALDREPYIGGAEGNTIKLTSGVCSQTGLQVSKRFTLLKDRLDITYTMHNPGQTELTYAPWEITRVGGGTTFYEGTEKALPISTGEVVQQQGHVWHHYDVSTQSDNEKVFANGSSGWLASAFDGLLLLKTFEPVPAAQIAPGEAEIEIYGHGDPDHPFVEVEQQGAYQSIAPGLQIEWSVSWYLTEIPPQQVEQGDLINLVKRTLEQSR